MRVYEQLHALVDVTGPSEAIVPWRAFEWLDSLNGSVAPLGTTWKGNQAEDGEEVPQYLLELSVDMSVAISEGRWPAAWFSRLTAAALRRGAGRSGPDSEIPGGSAPGM